MAELSIFDMKELEPSEIPASGEQFAKCFTMTRDREVEVDFPKALNLIGIRNPTRSQCIILATIMGAAQDLDACGGVIPDYLDPGSIEYLCDN